MSKLTHMDETGRARMVDVSGKAATTREAVAEGFLRMSPETLALALSGEGKKGDVRAVAEIAGVMAAKKTSDLIPMCHPLPIAKAEVRVEPAEGGLSVRAPPRMVAVHHQATRGKRRRSSGRRVAYPSPSKNSTPLAKSKSGSGEPYHAVRSG